jgi:hypothetical protein
MYTNSGLGNHDIARTQRSRLMPSPVAVLEEYRSRRSCQEVRWYRAVDMSRSRRCSRCSIRKPDSEPAGVGRGGAATRMGIEDLSLPPSTVRRHRYSIKPELKPSEEEQISCKIGVQYMRSGWVVRLMATSGWKSCCLCSEWGRSDLNNTRVVPRLLYIAPFKVFM